MPDWTSGPFYTDILAEIIFNQNTMITYQDSAGSLLDAIATSLDSIYTDVAIITTQTEAPISVDQI